MVQNPHIWRPSISPAMWAPLLFFSLSPLLRSLDCRIRLAGRRRRCHHLASFSGSGSAGGCALVETHADLMDPASDLLDDASLQLEPAPTLPALPRGAPALPAAARRSLREARGDTTGVATRRWPPWRSALPSPSPSTSSCRKTKKFAAPAEGDLAYIGSSRRGWSGSWASACKHFCLFWVAAPAKIRLQRILGSSLQTLLFVSFPDLILSSLWRRSHARSKHHDSRRAQDQLQVAPGLDVLDAYRPKTFLGSSLSTPHISGFVALLKSVHPRLVVVARNSSLSCRRRSRRSSTTPRSTCCCGRRPSQ